MKKFLLIILFIAPIINAFADNFQVLYREGTRWYSAPYLAYRILDRNDQVIARGYTDKYGRISASLRPGNYACEIISRNTVYRKPITFDGSTNLKDILLQ